MADIRYWLSFYPSLRTVYSNLQNVDFILKVSVFYAVYWNTDWMVKKYICSFNRNMYLWWCSNASINKDCRVYLEIFLLCLSWAQPWDGQQCAARGGEIWLQLTRMICPWAGNLTANFWKMSNPHPIPCAPLPPRRLNIDRCINGAFIVLK